MGIVCRLRAESADREGDRVWHQSQPSGGPFTDHLGPVSGFLRPPLCGVRSVRTPSVPQRETRASTSRPTPRTIPIQGAVLHQCDGASVIPLRRPRACIRRRRRLKLQGQAADQQHPPAHSPTSERHPRPTLCGETKAGVASRFRRNLAVVRVEKALEQPTTCPVFGTKAKTGVSFAEQDRPT